MSYEPISVTILKEEGPMPLHELTRKTALRMGWSVMYEDVDGVMRNAEREGLVRKTRISRDFRHNVWSATDWKP